MVKQRTATTITYKKTCYDNWYKNFILRFIHLRSLGHYKMNRVSLFIGSVYRLKAYDPKCLEKSSWPVQYFQCKPNNYESLQNCLETTCYAVTIKTVYHQFLVGYRCLRAIGFLTGLAAGAGCIVLLQSKNITGFGNLAAPGNKIKFYNLYETSQYTFFSALAVVAGLFGAILGSTHPISSILIGASAGALVAGAIIASCIATLPHYIFGVSLESWYLQLLEL